MSRLRSVSARMTPDGLVVTQDPLSTADILEDAAEARALGLSSGDATFGRRLIFAAGIAAISRDPAIIDLSTPELAREAPNTCAILNQALLIGIRTRLWD